MNYEEFLKSKQHSIMDLKEIQKRNYQATVNRGLITSKTTFHEFISKLHEEVFELGDSKKYCSDSGKIYFDNYELADIVLVCLAISEHYEVDILKALEEKTLINETRKS